MKKIYILLLALIVMNFSYADNEPSNDTKAGAEPIALNGSVSGGVTLNDYDYYELTIPQDGNITLTCISNSTTYTGAYVADSCSVFSGVVTSNSNGNFSSVTYQLAAGHYYIFVIGSDVSNYTLTNSFSSPTIPNDIEPNASAATAISLTLGDTAKGHIGYYFPCGTYDGEDYYIISIPVDGDITMDINNDLGGAINILLLDSDGTTLVNNLTGTGQPGVQLTTTALAAGTYYIKVSIDLGTQYCGYRLWYSFLPTSYSNDVEPNGTPAQAVLINLNNTNTGHLMHRNHGGGYDAADYYKIVLSANGNLSLPISNTNNNYIAIALYDATGTTYINSAYGNGQSGIVLNVNGLTAGPYIVKVYADLSSQYSGYQFSSSFTVGLNEINSITDLELFPNPVAALLNLKFCSATPQNAVINILNLHGEICSSESVFIPSGNVSLRVPVDYLPKGTYILQMIAEGKVSNRGFVK